jgi:predicted N-acetyltransferase YhbS
VRIRTAHPSDAPAIARVMRAAIRVLAKGTCTDRQLRAWSSLPALYHAWAMGPGGEAYLVAEDGGRIVGYAARRGREVTAAFVSPGRARAGVGAALLGGLEEASRRAGLRSLFVLAAPGAVPFYEALGYRGGRRVQVPLPGGVHLPARRLAKRLTRTARPRRASPP